MTAVLVAGSLVRPGALEPVIKPPRLWPIWAAGFAALFLLLLAALRARHKGRA